MRTRPPRGCPCTLKGDAVTERTLPALAVIVLWQVRFQMIFCVAGWVRVVYEQQGDPFVLHPGDMVIQPPTIRHRVLASSDGLEVVELSCTLPALQPDAVALACPGRPSQRRVAVQPAVQRRAPQVHSAVGAGAGAGWCLRGWQARRSMSHLQTST